jgi:TetR/AcrR family transcriptional repressor of lmrAB and yxaGH operons
MNQREKILATAARLFQTKGYSATGINEIIAECGAPKGSLYHYFPQGKVQLAIEAVNYAGEIINRNVANRLAEKADPVKAFQRVVGEIVDHFKNGSDFMDVSLSIISLEAPSEAESLRYACETILNNREAIYRDKLVASGFPISRAKHLSALIQTMIEGAIVSTRTRGNPSALAEVSQYLPILLERKE